MPDARLESVIKSRVYLRVRIRSRARYTTVFLELKSIYHMKNGENCDAEQNHEKLHFPDPLVIDRRKTIHAILFATDLLGIAHKAITGEHVV